VERRAAPARQGTAGRRARQPKGGGGPSALADAFHESARELLAAWFAWVRAGLEVQEWERQTALLAQELEGRRQAYPGWRRGKRDRLAAEAALAQSRASLTQAKGRQQAARSDLAARFPGLRVPPSVRLADPMPIPGGAEQWQQDIVAHSHGLIAAQTESRRWQTEMARQGAYERPNPTVGLFYGQERGGDEQMCALASSLSN